MYDMVARNRVGLQARTGFVRGRVVDWWWWMRMNAVVATASGSRERGPVLSPDGIGMTMRAGGWVLKLEDRILGLP